MGILLNIIFLFLFSDSFAVCGKGDGKNAIFFANGMFNNVLIVSVEPIFNV